MAEQNKDLVPSDEGWQARTLLMGGIVGTLLGVVSAYLYVKSAKETHGDNIQPNTPSGKEAFQLGMSVLAIVRTIMEWARR